MKPHVCNIRFVVNALVNGSHNCLEEEEKFQEKLLCLCETAFQAHSTDVSPTLQILQQGIIRECVVGPNHVAFLLDDGRVCRVSYSVSTKSSNAQKVPDDSAKEKSSSSKSEPRSSKMQRLSSHAGEPYSIDFLGVAGSGSWSRWGNRIGVIRSSSSSTTSGGSYTPSQSARKTTRGSTNTNSVDGLSSSGIRLVRTGQMRGRNLPLLPGGQRVMIPASHVPEELINQVQGVLQGKTKSVIVRELQRTNLDVNLAVNNLLSRDDEDNDDLDDGVSDYIPGEELMSLLDGGVQPGDHPRVVIDADTVLPEELLGYTLSSSRAISSSNRNLAAPPGDRDDVDDSIVRFSNQMFNDALKASDSSIKSKPARGESMFIFGDDIKWWTHENGTPVLFKLIGAMHSDLVAVDKDGILRQWKWASSIPYRGNNFHSRVSSLQLENEKISFLSTCTIQASVVTESGAISAWMDDSVAKYTNSLDLPCSTFEPIKIDKVKSLHVCSLYSVLLTELGRVYWWGVFPFSQRKKVIEKSQNNLLQNIDKDGDAKKSEKNELVVGSQVCLRKFPIYHAGAIAINIGGGTPKVGRLLQSVWNLEKKSSFELLSARKEDNKPKAAYEEQHKALNAINLRQWDMDNEEASRSHSRKRSLDEDSVECIQEEWELREVVFVEDVRSLPVGRVTKIDGDIVAVHFSTGGQNKAIDVDAEEAITDVNSCRLLRRDEVVMLRTNSPKVLDCVHKIPRRLQYDPRLKLHTIEATDNGIIAVASTSSGKLSYVNLSLGSGRVTSQRRFPTKPESFFATDDPNVPSSSKRSSSTNGCKLLSCGQGSHTLLQDYNSMLYPLLADENGSIRDPLWADLPPLFASGMGMHVDPMGNRCTITVLTFQSQVVMPLIMRRDLRGFEAIVSTAEIKKEASWINFFYRSLCQERCDGQRNVIHMCIENTIPSSNKEQKEDEKSKEEKAKSSHASSGVKQEAGFDSSKGVSSSAPSSSSTGSSNWGPYMSMGERMSAVNAIACAITEAKNGAPILRTAPHNAASSSSAPTMHPPMAPIDLYQMTHPIQNPIPEAMPIPVLESPRSRSAVAEKFSSPPASPVTTWPPDLPPYWAARRIAEREEGMNLSISGSSGSKKKNKSQSIMNSSWMEIAEGKDRGSRSDALEILKLICNANSTQPYLKQLLTHKDSSGCTPFMFAVARRAYPAALAIFKAAFSVAMRSRDNRDNTAAEDNDYWESSLSSDEQSELLSILYPPESALDDNPLYMLCCNDTCSFTWTGDHHINQDIFECLTCGLTDRLCCCTECAKVCHKGHNCKLKRTNPTAYCDCWEKCACKTLVEGEKAGRMTLLRMLLHTTNLYEKYNSSGEHIIQYLVQTVARQCEEQRQYRSPPRNARMTVPSFRSRIAKISSKPVTQGNEQIMPEHDLSPPQFCREALLQLFSDWNAVYSILMSGYEGRRDNLSMSSRLDAKERTSSYINIHPEDEVIMSKQSGTARLDMFTHTLIVKTSSSEYLDRLLETLIHTVQATKHPNHEESLFMCRRFLRSVIRVFVVLSAQSSPFKMTSRLSLQAHQPALTKCKRAFMALVTLSVEELCETAESLIAPVRMGVARPTSTYPLSTNNNEITQGTSAVFSKLPFPPKRDGSDDDDEDKDASKQTKNPSKSRKRTKASKSKRLASRRGAVDHGSEVRNETVAHDDESDHMMTSQDTQPVDDEIPDPEDQDLDNPFLQLSMDADEKNAEESDMDDTDEDLNEESQSDSGDSDYSRMETTDQGGKRSGDHQEEDDNETIDGRSQYDQQKKHDDEDTDSDHWQDEVNLERRSTREQRVQSRQAPHTMQWAMGSTSMVPVAPSQKGGSGGGGRPEDDLGAATSSGAPYSSSASWLVREYNRAKRSKKETKEETKISTTSATNAQLARLFAICVKEICYLLTTLQRGEYLSRVSCLTTVLDISYKKVLYLQNFVKRFMKKTWSWLLTAVEATECQLRYGQILSMASNPSHADHPHNKGSGRVRESSRNNSTHHTNEDASAKQDFLTYALSLMRSHNNEHSDLLPIVDISSLEHIAYVLDAYIYCIRVLSLKDINDDGKSEVVQNLPLDIGYDNSDNEEEDEEYSNNYKDDVYSVALQSDRPGTSVLSDDDLSTFSHSSSTFFRRSESMTFLGCKEPQEFEVPLTVALPLAEKPHILQPSSRKEELFGRPRIVHSNLPSNSMAMSVSRRVASPGVATMESTESTSNHAQEGDASNQSAQKPEVPLKQGVNPSHGVDIHQEASLLPQDLSKDASQEMTLQMRKDEPPESIAVAMETPAPAATVTVADENTMEVTFESSSSKDAAEDDIQEEIASVQPVLGKCRLTLELFSCIFLDSVGAEPNSILYELGGFEVRETKFRKEMERLRTPQTIDLQLTIERARDPLIQQTFKQLNVHAKRRSGSSQPMAVARMKVLFENEPGEGTGVARSFFTAISDALLSSERLPSLDGVLPGSTASSSRRSSSKHLTLVARLCQREREREERSRDGRGSSGSASSGSSGSRNISLRSFLTARYRDLTTGGRRGSMSSSDQMSVTAPPFLKKSRGHHQSSVERSKRVIGDRLYSKVAAIHAMGVSKITGMILELPAYELLLLLRSERTLQDRVREAVDMLVANNYNLEELDSSEKRDAAEGEPSTSSEETRDQAPKNLDEKEKKASDDEPSNDGNDGGPPLFYQPGKRGVYAIASWGDASDTRLNAYRNVGRIMGLCLLQNELCPLPFCRHVLKVILGRKIHWHDLAFFDPVLYESLRQLVVDAESQGGAENVEALELAFNVDLQNEEGGQQVDLIPDGANVLVTKDNIHDYLRRYALQRMVGCCRKQLEKLRQGVYDVLPRSSMANLTAEDLRLLANGCDNVDVRTLISYTMFNDESGKSGSSAEKLTQFKRWFWAVVDRFTAVERQELLYFWTGSPALPASEDGFQPLPSITIRPPDDQHLPTANTCISRLYVPLYSSKLILRQKLLIAIKTKNFGFV